MKGDDLDRKEEIIKKALKLFLQKGYEKASLNDIASEVGISKPGVYHYFANKDKLFHEVLSYFNEEMTKWSLNHFQSCDTIQDFLRTFFSSLSSLKEIAKEILGISDEQTSYSFLELLLSASKKDNNIKDQIGNNYIITRENIRTLLENAQNNGEIRNDIDCEVFAFQIVALIEGILLISSFDDSIDVDIVGEKIFNNIWKMLSV
jgi:AcrR family transcriptional regulator